MNPMLITLKKNYNEKKNISSDRSAKFEKKKRLYPQHDKLKKNKNFSSSFNRVLSVDVISLSVKYYWI